MIQTISRLEIIALCERLGHEPSKVARIEITPGMVEITYFHPITEQDPPEKEE